MTDIDEIKRANKIEDVVEETTPLERRRSRYLHGKDHDSLVVDVAEQAYFWNSKNEQGDVIAWLENRKGWDFKTAVEYLAKRGKLSAPDWGHQDNTVRLAARAREDALTVAARVFVKWLRASTTAVEYVHGRGWTDEAIRLAGLGYSGKGAPNEGKDLAGELDLHQVEKNNPGREAVMRIPHGMLIYPHVRGGRVKYLSCRGIVEKKHHNLPSDLAGPRQVYFNHIYGGREKECVIVEGQADAITLAQWGIPAVALAGTTFRDHNAVLEELKKNHEHIYLALDADKAGNSALIGKDGDWPIVGVLGAMTRIVRWGEMRGEDRSVSAPYGDAANADRSVKDEEEEGGNMEISGQEDEILADEVVEIREKIDDVGELSEDKLREILDQ